MKRSTTDKCGFTLIEMMVVLMLLSVLIPVIGAMLVSGRKHWNVLYHRVYRTEAIDGFAAHRLFDAVCRKASYRKALLGANNASLEVYYPDAGSSARTPENYARFYLSDQTLIVEHGKTLPDAWAPDTNRPTRKMTVASHVNRVRFDIHGAAVQMRVVFEDPALEPSFGSSVRHHY